MMPKPLASASGPSMHVFRQHATVVHLVDVISGQDQHVLGSIAPDQGEVLEHRVGGALVPVFTDLLLRRQDVDELVETAVEKAPAALQVLDQALCLVLRGDTDAADAGIDAVRQREVDDAEFAAEGYRRLRTRVGELHQAAAAPTGEDDGEAAAGEFAGIHRRISSLAIARRKPLVPPVPVIDCMVIPPLRLQSAR
jgi:hypothetical protein